MTEHRMVRGVEVRAELTNDGHTVNLHLIKPGVVDDYGSVWDGRSLDKGLEARMPVMAWAHNWSEPIGRPIDHRTSTDGPSVRFLLDDFDAVPRARQAWAQLAPVQFEGREIPATIQDCSIGFARVEGGTLAPTAEQRSQHKGIREFIREASAEEVSLVVRGAVPGAKVLAVRSAIGQTLTVPEDFVVDLAKKMAAGTIDLKAAKAALELVASGSEIPAELEAAGVEDGLSDDEAAEVAALLDEYDDGL